MRVFVPAQVQSNQDKEKTDFATLTLNFYKITKVNLATENMEMLFFFKFWRLQDMSFATALNMICNTQKHALKLIKKEKKYYDLLEIYLQHRKTYTQTRLLTKEKRKDINI